MSDQEAVEGKEAPLMLCGECGLPMRDHACPISTAPNLRQALENSQAQCEQLKRERDATKLVLQKLADEIRPLAQQIICPADNTFSRQLELIGSVL